MEDYYVMWLQRKGYFSLNKTYSLLKYFKSAENLYNASLEELTASGKLSLSEAERIASERDADELDEWIYELEEKDIRYISYDNQDYPKAFRFMTDPPLGIYVKGDISVYNRNCVSIIGARRCTEYGKRVAYDIAKDLAANGFTVVSGMARGLDSFANKGAIDAGGKTVAVLGFGLDICYPAENKKLMESIIENGCVISEYPLGTPAVAKNFPQRNRLIAALGAALIVVEAEKRSGTSITVNQALSYGRTVFAVPGNITSRYSEGTNELIKEGCAVYTEANDVLLELGMKIDEQEEKKNESIPELTDEELVIYRTLSTEPIDFEIILAKSGFDLPKTQYILTLLELKGHILKVPGNRYMKK